MSKTNAQVKHARFTAIAIDCMGKVAQKYAFSANIVASGAGSESMVAEAQKYAEIMEAIKYFEANKNAPTQGMFIE